MPYGALVQWHRRTQVCGTADAVTHHAPRHHRVPALASGSVLQPTPYLSMVWQVPVAGGPLAIQPPDIQIVEAAVMEAERLVVAPQKDEGQGAPDDSASRLTRRGLPVRSLEAWRLHPT